jgi:hypothetical protein
VSTHDLSEKEDIIAKIIEGTIREVADKVFYYVVNREAKLEGLRESADPFLMQSGYRPRFSDEDTKAPLGTFLITSLNKVQEFVFQDRKSEEWLKPFTIWNVIFMSGEYNAESYHVEDLKEKILSEPLLQLMVRDFFSEPNYLLHRGRPYEMLREFYNFFENITDGNEKQNIQTLNNFIYAHGNMPIPVTEDKQVYYQVNSIHDLWYASYTELLNQMKGNQQTVLRRCRGFRFFGPSSENQKKKCPIRDCQWKNFCEEKLLDYNNPRVMYKEWLKYSKKFTHSMETRSYNKKKENETAKDRKIEDEFYNREIELHDKVLSGEITGIDYFYILESEFDIKSKIAEEYRESESAIADKFQIVFEPRYYTIVSIPIIKAIQDELKNKNPSDETSIKKLESVNKRLMDRVENGKTTETQYILLLERLFFDKPYGKHYSIELALKQIEFREEWRELFRAK